MGKAIQRKADRDSTAIIITLNNNSNHNKPVDSVYIILDRYDRTGAGIVKQVFYPINNKISFSIPKGKYYVDIFCLGLHDKEHFGKIINAKSNKGSKLALLGWHSFLRKKLTLPTYLYGNPLLTNSIQIILPKP